MKLEKLNRKQITLSSNSMSKITGGYKVGDTRVVYSNGSAGDWNAGKASMDCSEQVYPFDPDCNCFGWEYTGRGAERTDPPSK